MKMTLFRNAGTTAAIISATAILSSQMVQAAPALALARREFVDGMGVTALVQAVVDFLKGKNAYVGPFRTWVECFA